jgi:cardiolipin synthase (CMP-forming)
MCATMKSLQQLHARDLLLPPNLASLSRVALTPFIGLALAHDNPRSTAIAVLLMIVAGVTDALDGYLARRLQQTTPLGLILDPVADKLFAAVTVVLLTMYREFPVWLAAIIIGRDLVILAAGAMFPGRLSAFPSTITGKYAFFYIVVLIGWYTIRYDFGIQVFTGPVIALTIAVLAIYGKRLWRMQHGLPVLAFRDRTRYRVLRIGVTALLVLVCGVRYLIEWMR